MSTPSHRRLEALRQEQRLCRLCSAAAVVFIHLVLSSWISEDVVPSHGHLVSSWSTGGEEHPALVCPACLLSISLRPWTALWCGRERGPRNQEEQKAIWRHPPRVNPAPGAWGRLFGFCWSIDDDTGPGLHLCLPHLICAASMLGGDKQQQDAPVFPILSAPISKDWVLASRCYNRNHLCSTWDRCQAAGQASWPGLIKPSVRTERHSRSLRVLLESRYEGKEGSTNKQGV